MTSYIKIGTWYEQIFISKCFCDHTDQLVLWSWLTLLKNQVKLTKQEIRSKNYWKTAKWRLYDVIRQSRYMIWKRKFFQNVSLTMLDNFYHDQHCLKIKLRWRNKGISQEIIEKRQNGVYKWRHTSKTDHDMKMFFFNISLIMLNNFRHDKYCLKIKL